MRRFHAARSRLAAAISVLAFASAVSADSLPTGFDDLVGQVQADFAIPGLAVAVVKDGELVLARGYGVRELGGRPVNARTRFPIASNTKAFTATALALLVEDGSIAWDTPVVEYLPEFALGDPYVTAHLTVRDLLAHNSGLPLGAGDLLWWPNTTHSMKEVLYRLRHLPLEKSFREGYAYDNVLYGVAGLLIERVSGRDFGEFVTERILEPLGMRDSALWRPGRTRRGNAASPHAEIDGKLQLIERFESDKTSAAGGLEVSIRDMARWVRTQLARGRIDGDQRLFSEASSRALWRVVTPMPLPEPPCDMAPLAVQFRGYALGFVVEDYRGRKVIRHGGGLPGFISDVTLVPDADLAIVVLTNQQVRAGITVIKQTLLDHYLGADDTEWLPLVRDCYHEKLAELAGAMDKVSAKRESGTQGLPAERIAGRYRDAWYGDIEIRQSAAGGLELDFLHTPALIGDLEHWHYHSYIVRWRDAPLPPNDAFITFTLDARGQVAGAKMEAVSPFTDFSYDFSHLDLKPVRTLNK